MGGSFFSTVVFKPSLSVIPTRDRGRLLATVGGRFTFVAWTSIVGVVVTGVLRAWTLGCVTNGFVVSSLGLGLRIVLVVLMILTGNIDGYLLKPRIFRIARQLGGSARTARSS